MSKIKDLFRILLYVFYPKRCFFCNEPVNMEDEACPECRDFPKEEYVLSGQHCKSCGERINDCACKRKAMFYADIIAPYYYTGPIEKAIHLFKFKDKKEKSDVFAGDMLKSLNEACPAKAFDFVCFVPQTPNELKKRGYNQAELLADAVCEKTSVKKLDALIKITDTPRQHSLHAVERVGNVMGVFDVSTADEHINAKNILLVDDVKTTGATLNECAKMLMLSGAESVTGLVYAIAARSR